MKAKLIILAVRLIMGAIALGIGIWYLSASLGGAALTYSSMDNFIVAIGVENGDIATANGCFLCQYIAQLFGVIGNATEMFWDTIIDSLWVLMAIGFGIYMVVHTVQYIFDAAKKTTSLPTGALKLEFKPWFDNVWKLAVRILIAGAILGTIGMGGTAALRALTEITITPVLFMGAELSMAASGVSDAATCSALAGGVTDVGVLNSILGPFMCVMGNLNAVMLAGAAGGFALMNYAWMGMGGGVLTWVSGLALVIGFLVIGFDLLFQVLSVLFKLIFLIIFAPLLVAAYAFEGTWKLAGGVVSNAVGWLIKAAVRIVTITLKIIITYAMVAFAADEFFPGPNDGYSAILPPMMGRTIENPDAQTMSVVNVFTTCEAVALADGEMDKDAFVDCFNAQRATVERTYPGAFDFMDDGWNFLLMMIGMFVLYFYVISPKIDGLIGKDGKEDFDYGGWVRDLGKTMWGAPVKITEEVTKRMNEGN